MSESDRELRSEITELRRLLEKHQWSGLTPPGSNGCCPECTGPAPPRGRGHRPGCALAAALSKHAPPPLVSNDPTARYQTNGAIRIDTIRST